MNTLLFFLIFISFFWFVRQTKAILFWLYLWQLKEYRFDRFLDHFRTDRGKKLFFNLLFISKVILLLYAFSLSFYPKLLPLQLYFLWILILVFLYLFESGKFLLNIPPKKPVLTKKALFLIAVNLILVILFCFFLYQQFKFLPYWFVFGLLLFDILTAFIVSGIVLIFQPFTIYLKNKIIKKAKEKRREYKDLIVIGITGSYGKTSTKEFLATILSERFKVLKTKKHQNTEMGVSQCILNELKPEHQIFVCEMAAYKKGDIKLLADITKPKIGIITGVNEQHLALFGSMENLLSAEGGKELIESLPEDGVAFFNGNNQYCVELYQTTKIKKYLYGKEAKTFGEENLLGAIAVARELGMASDETEKAIAKIENKLPGMEIKKGIKGITIIDASYSANPTGVMAHLEYLKTFPGKKIIVMPCLIELGSLSKEIHEKIGQKIAQVCDLAIITTADRFREIKKGAGKIAVLIEKPKEIFEKISSVCEKEDTVLLEGRVPEKLIKLLDESL